MKIHKKILSFLLCCPNLPARQEDVFSRRGSELCRSTLFACSLCGVNQHSAPLPNPSHSFSLLPTSLYSSKKFTTPSHSLPLTPSPWKYFPLLQTLSIKKYFPLSPIPSHCSQKFSIPSHSFGLPPTPSHFPLQFPREKKRLGSSILNNTGKTSETTRHERRT